MHRIHLYLSNQISIHSLRMEGDFSGYSFEGERLNFNPLPPYGGRLKNQVIVLFPVIISIHSLRMEGD